LGKPFVSLKYRCLDPSLITKPLIEEAHSIICMSGTLHPIEMYESILGFKQVNKKTFPNPFPSENKLSLIVPLTTTKYTKRDSKMYSSIANQVFSLIKNIPGNSLVFFPSYSLRDDIYSYFPEEAKNIFLEEQGTSKEQKEKLLDRFKRHSKEGSTILAVASGSLGEGIDLPGDYLKAVIIVGLPLAKPDLETQELIKYYDEKFGKGAGRMYGYTYPAIIKCLQNAGRCIRSETDRGTIIYVDERYAWSRYLKLFPIDMKHRITKSPLGMINEFFK
jgi:DNA excision repair protein ERCC-2